MTTSDVDMKVRTDSNPYKEVFVDELSPEFKMGDNTIVQRRNVYCVTPTK
jgi:hypothetical protein